MSVDQYSWPTVDVTIANGQHLSSIANIGRANVIGIIMPASWAAASLTFRVSIDGVTFHNLYDQAGNETAIPAAAAHHAGGLDALSFGSFNYIRVRSGTSGTPVNQAEDRVIRLILRNAGA
jgi:hypothetical protein